MTTTAPTLSPFDHSCPGCVPHEAFAMADEIGILHDGHIQQWDTAYNLYHRPANRFVADFIGQGVFLPASHEKADGGFSACAVARPSSAMLGWPAAGLLRRRSPSPRCCSSSTSWSPRSRGPIRT